MVKKLNTPPPHHRRAHRQREGHEARKGEEDTGQMEEEEVDEKGYRDRETPRGSLVEVTYMGGDATPPRGKRRPPGICL